MNTRLNASEGLQEALNGLGRDDLQAYLENRINELLVDLRGIHLSLILLAEQNRAMVALLQRLLDPDDLGYAVSQEVRQEVRNLLTAPVAS